MLLPAVVDIAVGNPDWRAFVFSSLVTFVCGAGLLSFCRCRLDGGLTLRQAFVLTPLSWTVVAFFGAVPMALSGYGSLADGFVNAFFESMSGLTTTGSTILVGLDAAPPGLLLWRALLQWMGGIGIIAVAIAILPALGIGGMQLFRTESSDRSEKVMPRARQIAMAILGAYVGLTPAVRPALLARRDDRVRGLGPRADHGLHRRLLDLRLLSGPLELARRSTPSPPSSCLPAPCRSSSTSG